MRALLVLVAALHAFAATAQERAIPSSQLRSGITFAGPDVRALQAEDASNPGMLWVDRGGTLWNTNAGAAGRSCASCHGDARTSMRGVAARYPAFDAISGEVMNLETRIESCRTGRQQASALPPEHDDRLALASWVAYQSRGMPMAVSIDGQAHAAFERGRAFYSERHGQMNLACAHCHDRNWSKRLLAETLSQGHPNAFPAYRLEWQGVGSLQRRIRACLFGLRAEMPSPGARELTDVELYLGWRAQGVAIEAPGVRR